MQIKAEEISKIIEDQIKNYEQRVEMSETGTVLYVGDGIARVYGVQNAMAMELLEFPGGVMGMVLNLEEDNVGVALLGSDVGIKEGDPVKRTGKIFSVPVGDKVMGRVLNPLASPSTASARSKPKKSARWKSRPLVSSRVRACMSPCPRV